MEIKKKLLTSVALGAIVLSQTGVIDAAAQIEDKDSVFMSINDKEVKEQELYDSITLNASYGPALEVADMKVLKAKYQDDSRLEKIIDEKYNQYKEENKEDDADLKKAFASYGAMDKDDFIDKSGILLQSYRELASIDVAYKEIFSKKEKDYVYNNKFSGDADIYHLLVAPKISSVDNGDEAKTKKAKEEALASAEKIIAEIKGGLSFEDAVKKYSDDKSNDTGKLGNYNVDSARKANIDQAIISEAFSLKDKEYSVKPVEGTYGYEIVMVKVTRDKETYENLKADVAKKLYDIYNGNNNNIGEYTMDMFRSDNKLEFSDQAMSKAYANKKLNSRKSYTQFDPNNQENQFGQGQGY